MKGETRANETVPVPELLVEELVLPSNKRHSINNTMNNNSSKSPKSWSIAIVIIASVRRSTNDERGPVRERVDPVTTTITTTR